VIDLKILKQEIEFPLKLFYSKIEDTNLSKNDKNKARRLIREMSSIYLEINYIIKRINSEIKVIMPNNYEFYKQLREKSTASTIVRARELCDGINQLFERQFEVPRIRNGERQVLTTLINEEAQLFAKYLRGERKTWVPRIPNI